MTKRLFHQSKHPFDPSAFEAFCWGSWRAVDHLRVEDGTMTMHLVDNGYVMDDRRPFQKLRLKSRKATLNDCTCFLRPGIDVCILYSSQKKGKISDEGNSQQIQEPVWLDAKIISIERKLHEFECSCQFYVSLYIDQGCLGMEKIRIRKDTMVVGINQISILQKIYKQRSMDRHYRWSFSEDCSSLVKTRLTLGKFLRDLSWLFVGSILKRVPFHVRTVQNKLIYQVMADEGIDSSDKPVTGSINAVNFSLDNGVSVCKLIRFNPADPIEEISGSDIKHETELSPCNELVDLRRSKRRNVKPERFSGCDQTLDSNNGWVRMMPYKYRKWKVDDDDSDDDDGSGNDGDSDDDLFVPLSSLFRKKGNNSSKTWNPRTMEGSIAGTKGNIVLRESKEMSKKERRRFGPRKQKELSIIPFTPDFDPIPLEQFGLNANSSPGFSRSHYLEEIDKYRQKGLKHGKKMSDLEEMENDMKWNGVQWKGNNGKSSQRRKSQCRSIVSNKGNPGELKTYKRVSLSAGAYNKLINSYMKNIDSTMAKNGPTNVVDQWEELKKAANCSKRKGETEESSSEEDDEGEMSDNEMLWREMELCMASSFFLEDDEVRVTNEAFQKSNGGCEHDYRLDEEIGLCCQLCGHVGSEIKHLTAPFANQKMWTTENKVIGEQDIKMTIGHEVDEDLNISEANPASQEKTVSEESDNVWALIPQLRKKLHLHQRKAFEFLWRNLAGSMEPALMRPDSDNIGGCVVSHSPGAGKTFLIIAFLASYLKLFPGKRPLVLAPKTTLYTWYKEFIKWEIPIPVHLIHGRRTYRVFKQNPVLFQGGPKPSQDVMHVLDCLDKIQKWHAQPSVLVMGYTSFLTLMREDSKFAHRKYMAKVLRESPGLLILDEGHNPRSTKSRLRKALMKVDTDLRILLSGTLFQNNFCEYFNTLCLARPKFVHQVLMELDPKFKSNQGVKKAPHLVENRARKFFLDVIAKKIDMNVGEERMQGLNMLRNMTNGFIDVYEGSGSADALPGLQIYTLLMNSTDMQHNTLVKLQDIMSTYHGYPLELELLITLAAIHPWLVKTSNCASKFFDANELMEFEKLKYDARKGSKVMFVLNLVYRVVKREKILIFCHNIAPIHLFLELFENVFRWQRGRELLTLTGDLELFERGRVIDKFEEPGGPSRVLLASITACAEGISLTAASRVIMLDSEWNPSKTKQAIARAFRPGQQKMVFVYQLLARGTLEEDKYRRTTWKEWVSSMIFSEEFVEDPSLWQAEKIEDDVLREIVEEDRVKSFHMIMKNEKASTG